jgi:hypothetical protein
MMAKPLDELLEDAGNSARPLFEHWEDHREMARRLRKLDEAIRPGGVGLVKVCMPYMDKQYWYYSEIGLRRILDGEE